MAWRSSASTCDDHRGVPDRCCAADVRVSCRTPSDWSPPHSRQSKGGGRCAGWRTGRRNRRASRLPTHRRHKSAFTPYAASDMKKRRYSRTALVRLLVGPPSPAAEWSATHAVLSALPSASSTNCDKRYGALAVCKHSWGLLESTTTMAKMFGDKSWWSTGPSVLFQKYL